MLTTAVFHENKLFPVTFVFRDAGLSAAAYEQGAQGADTDIEFSTLTVMLLILI